nr:MAG: E6 protein [Varecia variegata papillomavirus 2]WPK29464.1 MAG: E6 protein [Varecia variegata papillomavirus 2]
MERPKTVRELAKILQVPYHDVLLRCIFCKDFLSELDLNAFDYRQLHVIWRPDGVHGACQACVGLVAYKDLLKNTECTLEADGVEQFERRPLRDIAVRCAGCLKPLDYLEKLECYTERTPFWRVRDLWRGRCRNC